MTKDNCKRVVQKIGIYQINQCLFQVSLLLEYCCNGDLKSFLIKHKNEIEKLLLQFDNFGWMDDTSSKNLTTFSLDARMLHRWVYQVCNNNLLITPVLGIL